MNPAADLTVANESDLRDVATYQKWQETKKSFRQQSAYLGDEGIEQANDDGSGKIVRRNRICLFKLSDLGLWSAFPLIYLKRGLTIRLNLNIDHCLSCLKVGETVEATTLTHFTLQQSQARLFYIQPDEQHLLLLKDRLQDGIAIFPIHSFESHNLSHKSATGTSDISVAAALVEKTFVTWVNRGNARCFTQASNELAYTKAIFDSAGDRFMPPIKEL